MQAEMLLSGSTLAIALACLTCSSQDPCEASFYLNKSH